MSDDVNRHYSVSLSTATLPTRSCACGRELWEWQDACPKCGQSHGTAIAIALTVDGGSASVNVPVAVQVARYRQRVQTWGGS